MTILTDRDKKILELFDEIVVSFSGGKDSASCLIWSLETGLPVRAILTDTGNEPPETPDYLDYIENKLRIKIEVYQRPDHTFADIVRKRGMWPIPGRCLVSRMTKVDDFAWYLNQTNTSSRALIILGQRRSESISRRSLPDFSPIIRSGRAAYRPILDWTISEVFSFLDKHKIAAHPAYAKGRKRVGCIWCVNSKQDDLVRDEELYPRRCAELRTLRAEIGLLSIPEGIRQSRLFNALPICKYESVHCE